LRTRLDGHIYTPKGSPGETDSSLLHNFLVAAFLWLRGYYLAEANGYAMMAPVTFTAK